MLNWPSIQNPSYSSNMSEQPEDAVIRNSLDAGYERTRPRHTRNRTTWTDITWLTMNTADKVTLDNFYKITTGNGSAMFSWTNPADNSVHTVRFVSPPKYSPTSFNVWEVKVSLQEV